MIAMATEGMRDKCPPPTAIADGERKSERSFLGVADTGKMASVGHLYTLVGFSEEVDRRPLLFVEPLPVTRICSACGLVPHVKAFLPCEHFFCKSCYDQCVRSGRVACPLDGDTCSDDEVTWIEHPARGIMTKQVLCWNHTYGCNVITAAADISKHFYCECEHHMARCTKCSAEILASDVCAHLESDCDSLRVRSAENIQRRQTVEAPNSGWRMPKANSTAVSPVKTLLKDISRAFKIGVEATLSNDASNDERYSRQRLLEGSLRGILNQMAEQSHRLHDFENNGNASQKALSYSFLEKIEELKQSIIEAVRTKIDQTALTEEFALLRETIGSGQRETKAELAAQFGAFRAALREEIRGGKRETPAEHDKILTEVVRKCDETLELLRNSNAAEESLAGSSSQAGQVTAENLAQNASKIAWAKSTLAEDHRDVLGRFPSLMPVATTHTWTFEGYSSLKRAVQEKLDAIALLEAVYLRGYCVAVGIVLMDDEHIDFLFQLHKGKIDQFLEWPFNLTMTFRILHPLTLEEHTAHLKDFNFVPSGLHRPLGVSNFPGFLKIFHLKTLEDRGFVKDDRMLLRCLNEGAN